MGRLRIALSDTPLRREHERLLETLLRRGDVPERASEPAIDTARYHAEVVETARASWARRMLDEHRSASVFAQLVPQLMEAEAPLDLLTVPLRMAMDELRHGALCGRVVEALGGKAEIEADLRPVPIAVHAGVSPLARATRNVIYACCITETISVALTTAERDHTVEPLVRGVVDQLLGDEILHARYGWLYLAAMGERLSEEDRANVSAYLPFALKHVTRELGSRIRADPPLDEARQAERRALGLTPSALMLDLVRDTLRTVVVPQLGELGLVV